MLVGWLIIYILACVILRSRCPIALRSHVRDRYPVYSFFLPIYSFWCMDDFSWGQTRVVLGESGKKMIVHVSAPVVLPARTVLTTWYRTRASSIPARFLSSLGTTTYVRRIVVVAHV